MIFHRTLFFVSDKDIYFVDKIVFWGIVFGEKQIRQGDFFISNKKILGVRCRGSCGGYLFLCVVFIQFQFFNSTVNNFLQLVRGYSKRFLNVL